MKALSPSPSFPHAWHFISLLQSNRDNRPPFLLRPAVIKKKRTDQRYVYLVALCEHAPSNNGSRLLTQLVIAVNIKCVKASPNSLELFFDLYRGIKPTAEIEGVIVDRLEP